MILLQCDMTHCENLFVSSRKHLDKDETILLLTQKAILLQLIALEFLQNIKKPTHLILLYGAIAL